MNVLPERASHDLFASTFDPVAHSCKEFAKPVAVAALNLDMVILERAAGAAASLQLSKEGGQICFFRAKAVDDGYPLASGSSLFAELCRLPRSRDEG